MLFLAHIRVAPPDWSAEDLNALREKEKAVAQALQREGVLVALWREAGQLGSYSIWKGEDLDDVCRHFARLPFHPYMAGDFAEITRHPNALAAFPFTD